MQVSLERTGITSHCRVECEIELAVGLSLEILSQHFEEAHLPRRERLLRCDTRTCRLRAGFY